MKTNWNFEVSLYNGQGQDTYETVNLLTTMHGAKCHARAFLRKRKMRVVLPTWDKWENVRDGAFTVCRDWRGMVVGKIVVYRPTAKARLHYVMRQAINRQLRALAV